MSWLDRAPGPSTSSLGWARHRAHLYGL